MVNSSIHPQTHQWTQLHTIQTSSLQTKMKHHQLFLHLKLFSFRNYKHKSIEIKFHPDIHLKGLTSIQIHMNTHSKYTHYFTIHWKAIGQVYNNKALTLLGIGGFIKRGFTVKQTHSIWHVSAELLDTWMSFWWIASLMNHCSYSTRWLFQQDLFLWFVVALNCKESLQKALIFILPRIINNISYNNYPVSFYKYTHSDRHSVGKVGEASAGGRGY